MATKHECPYCGSTEDLRVSRDGREYGLGLDVICADDFRGGDEGPCFDDLPLLSDVLIEARALELHQSRKANTARNYPWALPLTFDGGERDFCLSEARNALAEEAYQAEQQTAEDRWYADQLATFTDADIAHRIGKIDEEVAFLPYRALTVNIADRGAGLADERRRLVAEQSRRNIDEQVFGAVAAALEPAQAAE